MSALLLLAAGPCSSDFGWAEKAPFSGNACPPVKKVVKKSEVEETLGGEVDEGTRGPYPLVIGVPTCRFSSRRRGAVEISVSTGLAKPLFERFKHLHRLSNPAAVRGLGEEALWLETSRVLLVRKGNTLIATQITAPGPLFSHYRARSADLVSRMLERI